MADEMCTVTWRGKSYSYAKGTRYADLAKDFQENYEYPIVLAVINGKLKELHHGIHEDIELEFETLADSSGHKAYKRSCCLLLIKSFYDVVGRDKIERFKVEFSFGSGYFCTVKGDFDLTDEIVEKVKKRMQELIDANVPIMKKSYPLAEIQERCHAYGMKDKEQLFRYRMGSFVNMYHINDFMDYYYGYMLPSTGYIKVFDLFKYNEGLVLEMARRKAPSEKPEFHDTPHLFNTMMDATRWAAMLGVETVGDLNAVISDGKFNDLVLVQEALQEHRIADIAEEIAKGKRRFVMIAGPSSSGKTSFANRLSIQLMAQGLKPHPISLDNYFVNRVDTPLLESGKPDYESLRALDVDCFKENMNSFLKGEKVDLPRYNFITGEREYNGNFLTMGKNDVLVIEGIHGLNDAFTNVFSEEDRYKIYISSLTTLNIDEHNRIPTTDGRLIRRLVRDYRTRGASASRTLGMWEDVRNGEERNIFPHQENADAMFNSALIYELSVLKQYAEPLLFNIHPGEVGYQEAVRLLKFLQYFLGVSTEMLPRNSLIREFVGGSCFDVG
ncbi:nucleoside kinase [Lachnospiraceae bacterium C1.1]|nr:nucleoside kinase [Lachnospiraceae bacterium C1.1]